MDTQERNYEKPSLSEYGKVKDLTAASSEGGNLDDDYPDDTPAEGIFS
ncbi:lasso RiPP family leader peptide-containing protein [Salinibacter sp.]|nr:lasso RiPP family leader peptide-containing protein [Salinibacter sp.]